jgi:uncharacterized protein
MAIEVRVFSSAEAVGKAEWNRLAVAASPMMEWEYFYALEESGVVSPQRGYRPCHLVAYDEGRAVVLAPFYERDRAWVEFGDGGLVELLSEMTGIPFNVGVVGAIPFTPVPGYQFLHSLTVDPLQAFRSVLDHLDSYCESRNLSTSRLYFVSSSSPQLHALLKERGYLHMRTGYALWFNRNYSDFKEYLLSLKSSRRTKIRRELRAVRDQGIAVSMVSGRDAPWEYFESIHTLYERTWDKHMGSRIRPFLNERFFHLLEENFRHRIAFTIARQGLQRVAMAFFYSKNGTLYGRYWGSFKEIPFLHFATCYYYPIAYAIEQGMTMMDPGFGGEHKLLRGYETIPAHHFLKFHGERRRRVAYSILKQMNLQNSTMRGDL